MKFPLKWGIVHLCRLINTGDIGQNVFFVKMRFLRFCNFFFSQKICDIYFIAKEDNPPACPQIRPIEQFWSMLKDKVYANNWSAKNRDQLIRKIRKCSKECDMAPILKMIDHLKGKIMKADQQVLPRNNWICIFFDQSKS